MPTDVDRDDLGIDDTPAGQCKRWKAELDASKRWLEKTTTRGDDAVNVYLDEREGAAKTNRRLGLFYADIQIKQALLYAKLPKARAKRRNADQNDDLARVGAEMLDRSLNADIENGTDSFADALWNNLEDWLIPGVCQQRWHYVAEWEDVPETPAQIDPMSGVELAPAVPAHRAKTSEKVDAQYVYWKHFRYSPCRVWGDARWVAFGNEMSRRQLVKRFGKVGKVVPLNLKAEGRNDDAAERDPTSRALVWEIWSKEDKRVYWVSEGHSVTLDEQDDPLGLRGFFPCPAPLIANSTTKAHRARSDYYLHQDLYRNCDALYAKLVLVAEAIAVRGLYDKNAKEIAALLQRTDQNQLIGIENWAALTDKGGPEALLWLMPIEKLAAAVQVITMILDQEIQRLQQSTGIADIMRGAAASAATATEQSIKAQYGNVRGTKKQKEFARFASDSLKLKAEIIAKHFDAENIVRLSNIDQTPDAPMAMQAAELLKQDIECYRIEVVPEDLSMEDLAKLKAEKTEWMAALAPMMQQVVSAGQTMPDIVPHMLEMVKWALAGLKGASTAEAIFDQAVDAWKQKLQQMAQQPPQPNPEQLKAQAQMQIAQTKAGADLQKIQLQSQAELQRIAAEAQAELLKQRAEAHFGIQETAATERIKAQYAPKEKPGA